LCCYPAARHNPTGGPALIQNRQLTPSPATFSCSGVAPLATRRAPWSSGQRNIYSGKSSSSAVVFELPRCFPPLEREEVLVADHQDLFAGIRSSDQNAGDRGTEQIGQCAAEDRADAVLGDPAAPVFRSEEHTSELQSRENLVCRL